jgi:hypothetical protein
LLTFVGGPVKPSASSRAKRCAFAAGRGGSRRSAAGRRSDTAGFLGIARRVGVFPDAAGLAASLCGFFCDFRRASLELQSLGGFLALLPRLFFLDRGFALSLLLRLALRLFRFALDFQISNHLLHLVEHLLLLRLLGGGFGIRRGFRRRLGGFRLGALRRRRGFTRLLFFLVLLLLLNFRSQALGF